ncbi:FMN2 [Symbiodinium sp. KB8]|nr:FMN2 [Symbiodinium sp. KB8]
MAAPNFDDDLFDFTGPASIGAASSEDESAESALPADSPEGAGAAVNEPAGGAGEDAPSHSSGRRKRGTRGGASSKDQAGEKKWRSGAIPQAPGFDGDVERNPYCLRHYKRRLNRWVRITREFLPPGEQALRALEQLSGEAELEFEEVPDDRFDNDNGIKLLLEDLEAAFGEREIFRQGGVIREFESICRLQGESVTAFVRRFQLLERKLQDSRVPSYPEQARTIKLLDGLKLDERAVASLLLAAGNKYQMKPILEAIRVQYPPGMSVTGLPRGLSTLNSRSSRASSSRASSFRSSSTASTRRSGQAGRSTRWSQWNTDWQETIPEGDDDAVIPEEDVNDYQAEEAEENEPNAEMEYQEDEDEEMIPEVETYTEDVPDGEVSALLAAAEALTVTSKKLAGLVQSRGYYQNHDNKGKGKSGDKGKGKFKGKKGKGKGKISSSKGKVSSKGTGKGAGSADRQSRLRGSLCLGCGSSDHWIRDCPHVNTYQAQVASADVELDPEGTPVVNVSSTWMIQVNDFESESDEEKDVVYQVPRPPSILLSTCEDASFLIADTGCQRQVAGHKWHVQKQSELQLVPLRFPEVCKFSFGPSQGVPSQGRWLYPAGIAGELVMLGVSEVKVDAPGLLSRPAMEALGAVPDLLEGRVTFKALNGRSTKLYLSPCGHLALRVDEWPEGECDVQAMSESATFGKRGPPDVVHPRAFPPERVKLEVIGNSKAAKALPDALQDQIRSSSMAAPLASDHEPPAGICVHNAASSSDVLSNSLEATPQGRNPPALLRTLLSGNHAHDPGCHGSILGTTVEQVPTGSSTLRPHRGSRDQSVRSRGDSSQDLRQLRFSLGADADGRGLGSGAKSEPKREDSLGNYGLATTEADVAGQGQGKSKSSRTTKRGSIGKVVTALIGLLAGTIAGQSIGATTPTIEDGFESESDNGAVSDEWTKENATSAMAWKYPRELRHGGYEHDFVAVPGERRHHASLAEDSVQGRHVHDPGRGRSDPPRPARRRQSVGGTHAPGRLGRGPGRRPPGGDATTISGTLSSEDDMILLKGSPDNPLGPEDRGCFRLKSGTRKRLAGAAKALFDAWKIEHKVYTTRVEACRRLRKYGADMIEIVEVDGGQVSEHALTAGLRVLQPIQLSGEDVTAGIEADDYLHGMLVKRMPYLIVWCRCPQRDGVRDTARRMTQILFKLHSKGVHFLIYYHGDPEFWERSENKALRGLPGVQLLRTPAGHTYLSSLGDVLGALREKDTPSTTTLSQTIVHGLRDSLKSAGDERWCHGTHDRDALPGEAPIWISGVNRDDTSDDFMLSWEPPGEVVFGTWFLDINRHHESWKPLLLEAEKRLRGLTTASITLKASPFLEQVKALVPWKLKKVQIFRAPKQRRLPQDVLMDGVQHRGAALMYNDETIALEAEAISTIINTPSGKYATPVRVCIYFYGDAPSTSLNPEENAQPEAERKPNNRQPQPDDADKMLPGQAGYRDISFPGSDAPTWVHQVLRRMHTNLGHPPREVLVRQLATAGASEVAVRAARKLRCETCLRVSPPHQPRTTKAVQARRFNDRVCMDIIYIKDIRGGTHLFLNLVDDGTVYQAATRLNSRSEEAVITALVNGWFTYFGPPDELAIDAEGAFRGMRFETLNAQLNVAVRCVPPDSHWQLGRAERHGQALKYNSARLIHQFAALTPSEVNVCVLMACYAKNRLVRRSGSSPNQWVFGRDPKLPASLLSDGGSIESAQVTTDSERLMQLEAIRTQALMNHHRYEAHESLRTALLRKSRPYRGAFTPGQKVAYYRKSSQMGDGEGSIEGYRQGIVLALDRNPSSNVAVNIWIRNSRGRLVQCSPEQCRPIAGEQEWWVPDEQDLEVLKNCDEDLRIHPRAFRAVGDRPSPADDRSLLDKSAEMDKSLNELPADDSSKLDAAFDFGSPVPATPVAPATPTAQDCGEQYRIFPKVKEREAFDNIVGLPRQQGEFVPPEYHFDKTDEIDYYQTPADALVTRRPPSTRMGWFAVRGADQPEDPPMEIPDYQSLMSGSGTLTLGYFSHGRQLGFTKDTWRHQHLARYLAKYLRFHGMQGDISSVFIACNVHSMYHKDRHNSRGSLNWQISHGDYVGGDLWVEREDHDHKYHLMTERMVCGRARFGYVLDTRRRLQAFRPDRHHGSDDFVGNRYVITAYKTRLVQAAPVEHLRELKALNFQTHEKTDGAQVMIANNAPLYSEVTSESYVPVTSAYPVKEQTSASSTTERVIALESSSEEEGHDGSFETRRAELQARKKEIHWRSLTEEEIPAFVEAVRKEWAEWERWSSCKEVRVGANEAVPVWRIKEVLYRLSVLKNLGWRQHSLDPCLFLWREHQQVLAVLGLHVDDLIAAALPGHEEILKQVEASFTWGAPWVSEDFTFIGRRVQQHEDGSVTVDQATYVNDIPTTKVKLPEDTLLSSHPELVTEFRSGIGSLQWLSSTTRGDVAADVSLVQRPPKELTVADLKEVNSVLRYVKATPDAKIRIVHIPPESLVFVAYGDSGFANAPNNKSQGGLVIVATDRRALREPCEASLLEWKSYRHQRVLRSTLAAEASALDRSHDHARFMAMVFSEMAYGDYVATENERAKHEVVPVTDARSLWDAVHRSSFGSEAFAQDRRSASSEPQDVHIRDPGSPATNFEVTGREEAPDDSECMEGQGAIKTETSGHPPTPRQVRIQADSRQAYSPEVTEALRERVAMLETLLAKGSPLKVGKGLPAPRQDEESSSRTLSEDSVAARSAPVRTPVASQRSRSVRISNQSSCFDSKSGGGSPRHEASDSSKHSVEKTGKADSEGTSDIAEGEIAPKSAAEQGGASAKSLPKGKGPPPPKGGAKGAFSAPPPPAPGKGKGKGKPAPPKAPPRAGAKAGLTKEAHNPRKAEIQPRLPMKKLFWNAFVLDDEHLRSCENVWAAIEKENADLYSFDVQELEQLFSETSSRSGVQTPVSHGGSSAVHRRTRLRARVFEESRRRQVCIMLARLPPVETTVKAIHDMDDDCLDKDQVELLLATAPTAEELTMLHAAAKEMPEKASLPWDDAEDFVWKLAEVGHFLVRLQTWSFENAFEERFHIFHSAVTEVKDACHALRDSHRIPRLLGITLNVGNYLNAGTSRGRADGFSVEVLSQMRALKGQAASSSSASTLLDFVVRQAERSKPGELLQLFGEVGEATLVQRAFRHNLKELSLELTAYCVQARGLARQSSNGDDVLKARAGKVEAHLRDLETLQRLFVEAEEDFNSVSAWFHEGCGKKPRPPDEFFGYWHTFFQGIRSTLEGMYAGKKRRKAPRSRVLRPLDQMAKSLSLSEAVQDLKS